MELTVNAGILMRGNVRRLLEHAKFRFPGEIDYLEDKYLLESDFTIRGDYSVVGAVLARLKEWGA